MTRVRIIGPGRLGCSLGLLLLHAHAFEVDHLVYHSETGARRAQRWLPGIPVRSIDELGAVEVDLTLIAVCDDAIVEVARQIAEVPSDPGVVLHTSGRLSAEALIEGGLRAAIGSFHPLQTFVDPSQAAERFRGCVVACEGDSRGLAMARELARAVGAEPVTLTTAGKAAYHAAAVVASNYLVVLTDLAVRLCARSGLDQSTALRILHPLQSGTLSNLLEVGLPDALTGPISRGDLETVRAHLAETARLGVAEQQLYRLLGRYAVDLAAELREPPDDLDDLAELLDTTRATRRPRS